MERLIAKAAALCGTSVRDILEPSRYPEHVRPRRAIIYVLVQWANEELSLSYVGRLVKRNHSTVIYNLTAAEKRMESDPDFRALVLELEGTE